MTSAAIHTKPRYASTASGAAHVERSGGNESHAEAYLSKKG